MTRSQFDRRLKAIQQDVLRMGALVESSCWLAFQAAIDRNLEAATQLAPQDQAIDQLYRQIEADCISVIALESPVSQDLRLLSAFMQLVRDLERIGDYAKDIGDLAIALFAYPAHPCLPRIGIMIDRCRAMLAMSLEALANLDAQAGLSIESKDDWVDLDYQDLYQTLVNSPLQGVEGETSVETIVLLVLVIRYVERMADHATNIGNRVVYAVTGERF